jgi:hypothetical protein
MRIDACLAHNFPFVNDTPRQETRCALRKNLFRSRAAPTKLPTFTTQDLPNHRIQLLMKEGKYTSTPRKNPDSGLIIGTALWNFPRRIA